MLEKYISSLLVPYLCKFAENVDPKQLNVSLWSGCASLKDLVLKADVLDTLMNSSDLPLRLQRGVCKSIKFDIPIKDINSKPLEAKVAQVLLCFTTVSSGGGGGQHRANERKRAFEQTEAALALFEEERKRKSLEKDEAASTAPDKKKTNSKGDGGSVLSRLSERVINNVIVRVESVHIRVEDPDTQTCFGFVLKGVTLVTTNERGDATFVDPTNIDRLHKHCTLDGVEVYCETPGDQHQPTRLFSVLSDKEEWERCMLQRSSANDNRGGTPETIFGPVAGSIRIAAVMQQHLKKLQHLPYINAAVELDNVVAAASRDQYTAILAQISRWNRWKVLLPLQHCRQRLLRAKEALVKEGGRGISRQRAQALWSFVRSAIRTLHKRPLEKILRQRASVVAWGPTYERLYEKKLRSTKSTNESSIDDDKALQACVHQMLLVDLISARKRVYKKLSSELTKKRQDAAAAAAATTAEEPRKPKRSGLLGFLGWGGAGNDEASTDPTAAPSLEAIEKEYGLDHTLEDDDYETVKASLPVAYCWARVHVRLPQCGFNLRLPEGRSSALMLKGLGVGFEAYNHSGSFQVEVSSDDLSLTHPLGQRCKISDVLSRARTVWKHHDRTGSETPHSPAEVVGTPVSCSGASPSAGMFYLKAVLSPPIARVPGTTVDVDVAVRMRPLCLFLDPSILTTYKAFFAVPREVDISSIAQRAKQLAVQAQSAATSSITNTLASAKVIQLAFDAAAPIIVLTTDAQRGDAETVCMSLGRARLHTKVLPDEDRKRRAVQAAEPNADKLLLYGSNTAEFSSLFATITTLDDALKDPRSGFTCLPEVHFDGNVLQRLVPASVAAKIRDDTNNSYEALIVHAKSPALHINASLHQVHRLTQVLDAWRLEAAKSEGADSQRQSSTRAIEPQLFALPNDTDPMEEPTEPPLQDDDTAELNVSLFTVEVLAMSIALFRDCHPPSSSTSAPWCALTAAPISLSHAKRTRSSTLRVHMSSLVCGTTDATVFGGPSTMLDFELVSSLSTVQETGVCESRSHMYVNLRPVLECHLGTPLMEVVEFVMDAVHLLPSGDGVSVVDVGAPAPQIAEHPSAALQAPRGTPTTSISVDVEGVRLTAYTPSTTSLASPQGDDTPLVRAGVDRILVSIGTWAASGLLKVSGSVQDASLELAREYFEGHYRCVEAAHIEGPLLHRTAVDDKSPLVQFAFYTTTAPGPHYGTRASGGSGPRPILNAAAVGFTKHCEVTVGDITGTADMHAIMVLLKYFTDGYFARLTEVAGRPRYDGKIVPPPPEGPQLLMRLSVFVKTMTLTMPTNPAGDPVHDADGAVAPVLYGTINHMTIENTIDAEQAQATMNITLFGVSLASAATPTRLAATLMEPVESLTISIRATIDPQATATSSRLLTVTAPFLGLRLTDRQLVDFITLIASNILRMVPPAEDAALTYKRLSAPPSNATTRNSSAASAPSGGVVVRILLESTSVTLLSENAAAAALHRLTMSKLSVCLIPQNQQKQISWDSIGVYDVRGTALDGPTPEQPCVNSALLLCGQSTIELITKSAGQHCQHSSETTDDEDDATSSCNDVVQLSGTATQVLEIDVGFSIRRFAISEQWLSVHDFIINESVMRALKPLMGGAENAEKGLVSDAAQAPQQAMELVIRAETFLAPFLAAGTGEELFLADINSFELRMQRSSGAGMLLRIDVFSVRLTHCASQTLVIDSCTSPLGDDGAQPSSKLLHSRSASAPPPPQDWLNGSTRMNASTTTAVRPLLMGDAAAAAMDVLDSVHSFAPSTGAATATATTPLDAGIHDDFSVASLGFQHGTSPIASTATANAGSSVLRIELRSSDGESNIAIHLQGLHAVFAMPVILQLADFCSNAEQPVSKISQLSMMREERERVARLAVESQTAVHVSLTWCRPQVIVVGDVTQLSVRRAGDGAHDLVAFMDQVKTELVLRKTSSGGAEIDVTTDLKNMSVRGVTSDGEGITMAVSYSSKPDGGNNAASGAKQEEITVAFLSVTKMTISHKVLEDVSWILARNIAVPFLSSEERIAVTAQPELPSRKDNGGGLPSSQRVVKVSSNYAMEVLVMGLEPNGNALATIRAARMHMQVNGVTDATGASTSSTEFSLFGLEVVDAGTGAPILVCGAENAPSAAARGGEADPSNIESVRFEASPNGDAAVTVAQSRLTLLPTPLSGLMNLLLATEGPPPVLRTQATAPNESPGASVEKLRRKESTTSLPPRAPLSPPSLSILKKSLLLIHFRQSSVTLVSPANPNDDVCISAAARKSSDICRFTVHGATVGITSFSLDGSDASVAALTAAGGDLAAVVPESTVEVLLSVFRGEDLHSVTTKYREFLEPFRRSSSDSPAAVQQHGTHEAAALLREVLIRCHSESGKVGHMSDAFYSAFVVPPPLPENPSSSSAPFDRQKATISSALAALRTGDCSSSDDSSPALCYQRLAHAVDLDTFVHIQLSSLRQQQGSSQTARRTFRKKFYGRISSVSFVAVPALLGAVSRSVSELTSTISDVASRKTRQLAQDRAAALRSETAPLTQFDVVLQRPRLVMVSNPNVSECLEVFPGQFTLTSALGCVDGKEDESYTLAVSAVEVRVNGKPIFRHEKALEATYVIPLAISGEPTSAALDCNISHRRRELKFVAPKLDIAVGQEQLNFIFDMLGDIRLAASAGNRLDHLDDDAEPIRSSGASAAAASHPIMGYASTLPPANHGQQSADARSATDTATSDQPSSDDVFVSVSLREARVDVANTFSLRLRDLVWTYATVASSRGVTSAVELGGLSLCHGDASQAPAAPHPDSLPAPIVSSLQLVHFSDVVLHWNRHRTKGEDDTMENNLDANIQQISLSITPRIVADFIGCVYEPMFVRCLRVPLRPKVALLLQSTHCVTLSEDLVLDDKHLLVATNGTLRTFEVNLNRHRLILKGGNPPRPLILLGDGCEVLFTNGTIYVTGAYTLGSFVAYGLQSAIRCSDVTICKRMFNAAQRGRVATAPEEAESAHSAHEHWLGEQKSTTTQSRSPSSAVSPHLHEDPNQMRPQRVVRSTVAYGSGAAGRSAPASPQKTQGQPPHSPSAHPPTERDLRTTSETFVVRVVLCLQLHVLSDHYDVDLGFASRAQLSITQRTSTPFTPSGQPLPTVVEHRNVQCALQSFRSVDDHTLRPSEITVSVAGVDHVAVQCDVSSVEMYINTMYLGRVARIANEFTNALDTNNNNHYSSSNDGSSPTTTTSGGGSSGPVAVPKDPEAVALIMKRANSNMFHIVDMEDEQSIPLRECMKRGHCRFCRDHNAVLGSSESSGKVCWKCATGRREVVANAVDVKIALIDIVVANNHGGMLQLRADVFNLDLHDRATRVVSKMHLWLFNPSFGVWEPIVEHCVGNATWRQLEQVAQLHLDQFSYVMSLHSVHLLSTITADLQHALAHSDALPPKTTTPDGVNGSPTDSRAANIKLLLRNCTFESFVLEDKHIRPHDATDISLVRPEIHIALDVAKAERMSLRLDRTTSFTLSPLGCAHIIVEVQVTVALDGVSMDIVMRILPLHVDTNAFLAVRNTLPMRIQIHGLAAGIVHPNQVMFLPPTYAIDSTFRVLPLPDDDEAYSVAETNMNVSPPRTVDILNGNAYDMIAHSKTSNRGLHLRVARESGEPIAGAPTHIIVVDAAVRVQNDLSCPISVDFFLVNQKGEVAGAEPAETVVCEPHSVMRALRMPHVDACKVALAVSMRKCSTAPSQLFLSAAAPPRSRKLKLNAAGDTGEVFGLVTAVEQHATIRLCTPFAVVNHTPFELELNEVQSGTGRFGSGTGRKKNFSVLPPMMKDPTPVLPDEEEKFFAMLSYTNPTTKSVFSSPTELPFHVPGVVSQAPLVHTASEQTMHLVFMTSVDPTGTRVVELSCRWVLVNRLDRPLYVGQLVNQNVVMHSIKIEPKSATPFVVTRLPSVTDPAKTAAATSAVQLRVAQTERVEPGIGFPIEEIGNFVTVARGTGDTDEMPDASLDVAVTTKDIITYIMLEVPDVPPYVLSNRTYLPLTVRHAASKRVLARVAAYSASPFSFEVSAPTTIEGGPATPEQEFVSNLRETQQSVEIEMGGCTPIVIPLRQGRTLAPKEHRLDVGNGPDEGGTFDLTSSVMLGNHGQRTIEVLPTNRCSDLRMVPIPTRNLELSFQCLALKISVVHKQVEITFGLLENVRAHLKRTEQREILQFSVNSIQFDNQSEEAPVYETALVSIRKQQEQHAVALFVERKIVLVPSVIRVDEVRLDIAPLAVHLTDAMLLSILSLVQDYKASSSVQAAHASSAAAGGGGPIWDPRWSTCPTLEALYQESPRAGGWMAMQMYIDRIVVNPVILRVWFVRSSSEQDVFRQQLKQQQAAALISMMVGSLDDVVITAPGITAQNENRRVHLQIQRFVDFYVAGLNRQLIGLGFQFASSLPFIGVPIRLVSDVGSGAVKFFKEPIDGLTTSPKAFALGLAKGSVGLVGNVLGGGFTAVANVANATSNIARIASGTTTKEHRSGNVVTGFVSGLTGIVTKPMKGYAEEGAAGLLKGIGQGVIGVAAAPMSGLLSDVGKITGAAATVFADKYLSEVKRMRQVRLFHAGGAIALSGSVVQTCQYQRRKYGGTTFSDRELLPTDGPTWSPKPRDQLQAELRFPADRWAVETYHTTLDGWKYCERYESESAGTRITKHTHVRRRRWVAVVHQPAESVVAPPSLFLGASKIANTLAANTSTSFAVTSPVVHETPTHQQDAPPAPATHMELRTLETFENQRKYPLRGWTSSLLPTDRHKWSSRDGKQSLPRDGFALPDGWQWESEWELCKGEGTDKDGWSYAIDFSQKFGPREDLLDYVRRRCWRRRMVRMVATSSFAAASTSH